MAVHPIFRDVGVAAHYDVLQLHSFRQALGIHTVDSAPEQIAVVVRDSDDRYFHAILPPSLLANICSDR